MKNLKFKVIKNGIIAVLLVILINFIILFLLGFPQMAFFQIKRYWFLLILLILGFGVQIGLYTYLKHKSLVCSATVTTSGGISVISMILCCSHYVIAFIPFLSISAATFLLKYTFQILLFGVLSNIIGILMLIKKIK